MQRFYFKKRFIINEPRRGYCPTSSTPRIAGKRRPCYNGPAMREISSLTLVLSDTCNFSCPYCPQHQGKNTLQIEDITAFPGSPATATGRRGMARFLWRRTAPELAAGRKNGCVCGKKLQRQVPLHPDHQRLAVKKGAHFILQETPFRPGLELRRPGPEEPRCRQRRRRGSGIGKPATALYPAGYAINSVFTPRRPCRCWPPA